MKTVKICVWIAVLYIVQCVLTPYIRIAGAVPELLFIFAICTAYFEKDAKYCFVPAAVCGLLAGSMYGVGAAFYLIFFAISAVAVSMFSDIIYTKIFVPVIPVVMIMTFVENSLFFLTHNMLSVTYSGALTSVILPVTIYNTVIAVPIGYFVKKIYVTE